MQNKNVLNIFKNSVYSNESSEFLKVSHKHTWKEIKFDYTVQ